MAQARAIIFDFNGTLSDDEPVLVGIYQSLFAEHGRPLTPEQYFSELAGNTEEAIIGSWLGVDGAELEALVEERIARYLDVADGSTIAPQRRAAVRLAAEHGPIGLVSGAFRAEIQPVIEAAGIAGLFGAIVTGEDVAAGKPAPDGYLRALELLGNGLRPSEVVALEDTEAGVASAKAAGLRCVAVLGTLPPERLRQADEIVPGLDIPLIERLLG